MRSGNAGRPTLGTDPNMTPAMESNLSRMGRHSPIEAIREAGGRSGKRTQFRISESRGTNFMLLKILVCSRRGHRAAANLAEMVVGP